MITGSCSLEWIFRGEKMFSPCYTSCKIGGWVGWWWWRNRVKNRKSFLLVRKCVWSPVLCWAN